MGLNIIIDFNEQLFLAVFAPNEQLVFFLLEFVEYFN